MGWVSDVKPYRSATGTTAVLDKPDGTFLAGDAICFLVSEQGTISGTTPMTTPAGTTRIGSVNGAADRAFGWFIYPITDPANIPATFTFGGFSTGRGAGFSQVYRGIDLASLQHTSPPYSSTDLAAFEADGTPFLFLAAWTDQRTTPRSHVPTTKPASLIEIANLQSPDAGTTGSRTAIWAGYMERAAGAATAVGAQALVWPDGVSANKSIGAVLRLLPESSIPGVPVEQGDGTTAYHNYVDETGTVKPVKRVALWLPGPIDVDAWIATQGGTAAHRGLSLENPEYAEVSYDDSVFQGFSPLEISLGFTQDNVPFGMGDQYLDRMAGVSGSVDPLTMTWATLSSTYRNVLRPLKPGVTQPFLRLDDMLEKYHESQVILVDPKFGWSTPSRVAEMLDICDEFGGPEKIIIKYDFPVTDPQLVNAAKAREYKTMNYWGTNQAALTPTYHTDKWDLIGVAYNSPQAMYDAALAIGKKVWAAVIPNQAGYDLAATQGANLMMCASGTIQSVTAR